MKIVRFFKRTTDKNSVKKSLDDLSSVLTSDKQADKNCQDNALAEKIIKKSTNPTPRKAISIPLPSKRIENKKEQSKTTQGKKDLQRIFGKNHKKSNSIHTDIN